MSDTANKPSVGVRRSKSSDLWFIADAGHKWFAGSFRCGLMTGVTFVKDAPAMQCEAGYESTGEAVGVVTKQRDTRILMPKDAKRTLSVVYDRDKRVFHVKGKPKQIVETADYLLLKSDGTAFAGYKK